MSVPRIKSESGFYHVMNRGVSLMTIFEDDEDRRVFLRLLSALASRGGVELHAYCLMSNHYHLLVRDDQDALSLFCQNLNAAYAKYFNEKYERIGPLFQSRFRSEALRDNEQYLTVLRYIVQNPLKAGLGSPEEYPWSSYAEYGQERVMVEPYLAVEMLGGLDALRAFLSEPGNEAYLDISADGAKTDDALRDYLLLEFDCRASEVSGMERGRRNRILVSLRAAGFSVRRIERVTGVGRGIIQKAR